MPCRPADTLAKVPGSQEQAEAHEDDPVPHTAAETCTEDTVSRTLAWPFHECCRLSIANLQGSSQPQIYWEAAGGSWIIRTESTGLLPPFGHSWLEDVIPISSPSSL